MEVEIGKMNELAIVRVDDKGGFLDAGKYGEVFLPLSQLPENPAAGLTVEVFCYMDDGRLTVTAHRPRILLGEAGRLTVKDVTPGAAYLDWGIRKDLMIPFREQLNRLKPGDECLVYVAKDREGRLYATQKFDRFISETLPRGCKLKSGDRVELTVISHTPLGFKMLVNNSFYGLLAEKDALGVNLVKGKRLKGYIHSVRRDFKVNLSLSGSGMTGVASSTDFLLRELALADGFLPYGDFSSPEEIEQRFHMSKGKFKKVIGNLYKLHRIELLDNGIRIIEKPREADENRVAEESGEG